MRLFERGGRAISDFLASRKSDQDNGSERDSKKTEVVEPQDTKEKVVASFDHRYGGQQTIEVVEFEDAKTFKETFPGAALLEGEVLPPDIEKIASVAHMEMMRPEELVCLTPKAVRERLDVFLMTSPVFSKRDPVIMNLKLESGGVLNRETGGSSVDLGNVREPTSLQLVVNTFKEKGFTFVKNSEGSISMAVDATVPVAENTNGKFGEKQAFGSKTNQGLKVGAEAFPVSAAGFRPATAQTREVILVPLEEIGKLHFQNGPQSIRDEKLAQAEPVLVYQDKINLNNLKLTDYVASFFARLQKNPEFKEEIDAIQAAIDTLNQKYRNHPSLDQTTPADLILAKRKLFDLLTIKLGLRSEIANQGYFPYEPVFPFAYPQGSTLVDYRKYDDNLDVAQLQDLNNQSNRKFPPSNIYLDQLLELYEYGPRREAQKQNMKKTI